MDCRCGLHYKFSDDFDFGEYCLNITLALRENERLIVQNIGKYKMQVEPV
jgi:hypothetical protein